MNLIEARECVGSKVLYRPNHQKTGGEEGVITSVGKVYVFVRYGDDSFSKATSASMLRLIQ